MRRAPLFLATVLAAVLDTLAGCAQLAPRPALEFALLGDVPYTPAQVDVLDTMIDDMNAARLAFAVHVGDITSGQGPCTDAWLLARKEQFSRFAMPFVLLPGDNEWTDCHRSGFDPAERLAKWRSLFCEPLGSGGLALERQSLLDPRYPEYCEHLRWQAGGALFVGLNVPDSNNNLGRTRAMDAEHARRMEAALAWLAEGVERARERRLALVVLIQANPGLDDRIRPPANAPDGHASLRAALAAHALGRPLILVHGGTHLFRDDRPLPGLRRIEVDGAPRMSWLRATLPADGELAVEQAAPTTRWPPKRR